MTSNPIDPKKQNVTIQQPNELSEQELESVAGGGIINDVKDFAKDVYKEGKELVSDVGDAINNIKKAL